MRSQTTLDFLLGVSLFLLILFTVFAFVPATLQPFTQSAQEEMVSADRIADLLVTDLLVDGGKAYLLDGACTAALLSDGSANGCGFDGDSLKPRLDLPARLDINITVQGEGKSGSELLCWDSADERVVGRSANACGSGDTLLRAGQTPPSSASTVRARRIVSISGTTGALEVRMW